MKPPKISVTGAAGKTGLIAAEDQARVIAGILRNPKPHKGQIHSLYGPAEYTSPEIAAMNGLVEWIMGQPPLTIGQLVSKHRAAFV